MGESAERVKLSRDWGDVGLTDTIYGVGASLRYVTEIVYKIVDKSIAVSGT